MQCDGESGLTHGPIQDLFKEKGIEYTTSTPHKPQQIGQAEVHQYHLHLKAAAMLADSKLPQYLWPLALEHAQYLKNISPAARLGGRTPFESRENTFPDEFYIGVAFWPHVIDDPPHFNNSRILETSYPTGRIKLAI
jgi:hypothetical protein